MKLRSIAPDVTSMPEIDDDPFAEFGEWGTIEYEAAFNDLQTEAPDPGKTGSAKNRRIPKDLPG